jgi:hypothetical protein
VKTEPNPLSGSLTPGHQIGDQLPRHRHRLAAAEIGRRFPAGIEIDRLFVVETDGLFSTIIFL